MDRTKTTAAPMAPLAGPGWQRVVSPDLETVSTEGWRTLDAQRDLWLRRVRPETILTLFQAGEGQGSFGYETSMYEHCLRAGTRALRDGLPDETVAAVLLHDIAYPLGPPNHGEMAALMLAPYISEANEWMLRHHQIFIDFHSHQHESAVPDGRERFRGHPHFAWTAQFCERYDQSTIAAADEALPLAAFMPLLERVFSGPLREVRK
jgi:predicted HD phosphohydrolase